MARPSRITRDAIAPFLRSRGPISSTELAGLLHANRATISRVLAEWGDDLVTIGATRSTRYLLRRNIRDIGSRWPLYQLDENGRAHHSAEIEAFHDDAWRVNWTAAPPEWAAHFLQPGGLWSGFPFFLSDIRPQGFLGRNIARRLAPMLRLPGDTRDWSDEDTLLYLQASGADLPGNLILGSDSLNAALGSLPTLFDTGVVDEEDRGTSYAEQAANISQELPASSAGGEQPKFLTTLRDTDGLRPVLVKFSAPAGQPAADRWRDLLLCEWHAHEVLAEAGSGIPGTRILDAGGRRFLEVPRFDRTAAGGRIGMVSLEALSTASIGMLSRDWTEAAGGLHQAGLIDAETLSAIHRRYFFGHLIGNTDMHFGNLSFFMDQGALFRLTPSYDMLPMLWAPGPQGEMPARTFTPRLPLPGLEGPWREAAALAEKFWERILPDKRLFPDFREQVRPALETVRRLRQHVG